MVVLLHVVDHEPDNVCTDSRRAAHRQLLLMSDLVESNLCEAVLLTKCSFLHIIRCCWLTGGSPFPHFSLAVPCGHGHIVPTSGGGSFFLPSSVSFLQSFVQPSPVCPNWRDTEELFRGFWFEPLLFAVRFCSFPRLFHLDRPRKESVSM